MTLRQQLVLTGAMIAVPVAVVASLAVGQVRDRDRHAVLVRIADAHLTDVVRDACEADPMWFLAGPRAGRPSAAQRAMPDADVYLPRPATDELPFEVFAYDQEFQPGSSAAPRFPADVRRELRGLSDGAAFGRYASRTGEGIVLARITGWSPGPCAVLMFRLRPEPGARTAALLMFAGFVVAGLLVAAATTARTEARVRSLARAVRTSAREDYALMAPVGGRDEVGALGAAFNEAAVDIRRRIVDARDREEALRRHARQTTEDVARPLADVERQLAAIAADPSLGEPQRHDLRQILVETHRLTSRLNNLAAVARLRATAAELQPESVDIAALAGQIVAERAALAEAIGVTIEATLPATGIEWQADRVLMAQAVANAIDNAILHSQPGGRVRVELRAYEGDRRFTLVVADDGPGVSDEAFAALTANRRFRGDEGRSGRGGRGLGLAVAREVADRFGLQLDLARPSSGGFEVTFRVR